MSVTGGRGFSVSRSGSSRCLKSPSPFWPSGSNGFMVYLLLIVIVALLFVISVLNRPVKVSTLPAPRVIVTPPPVDATVENLEVPSSGQEVFSNHLLSGWVYRL